MDEVVIEIYREGRWHKAAEFSPYGKDYHSGYRVGGRLSYDIDYVLSCMEEDRIVDRVGCLYPVNFNLYSGMSWPAFLLDLLPTGAAREAWLKSLGLRDDESSWWQLLRLATGNPPGNLRIAGAAVENFIEHPGFDRQEIIEKNVNFIEYAETNGALVAGASDVQGQARMALV